jgi:hypothetical protein
MAEMDIGWLRPRVRVFDEHPVVVRRREALREFCLREGLRFDAEGMTRANRFLSAFKDWPNLENII